MTRSVLAARILLGIVVALYACGGLTSTDRDALQIAAQSNAYAYRDELADAGAVAAAQNRAAYCGLRAILLRQKQAVPDAGIVCPQ